MRLDRRQVLLLPGGQQEERREAPEQPVALRALVGQCLTLEPSWEIVRGLLAPYMKLFPYMKH